MRGKVGLLNQPSIRHGVGPLHRILELSHVSGPRIALQSPDGLRGKRGGGLLGDFFERVSRRILIQEGESLREIWNSELKQTEENRGLALSGEDLAQLKSLGNHLGYLDVDMQERMLLLYLEQADLTIADLREHKREKCRLYTSMGVMGGIFLVIIMM